MLTRHPAPAPQQAVAPSSASVVATAPAPIEPGKGQLLLSASPWANVEQIIDSKGKAFPVGADESTPTRIDLPPGDYKVTLAGPDLKKDTFDVHIETGKQVKLQRNLGAPNLDELEREVNKQ
jgi:hypothetical protein